MKFFFNMCNSNTAKMTKKKIIIIILFFLFFACFAICPKVCTAIDYTQIKNKNILNSQFEESNANELKNAVDDETKKNLDELGVSSPEISQMQNFSVKNFFKFIFVKALQTIKQPIVIFSNCLAVILITALFYNFKPNSSANNLMDLITTLCTYTILITPIIKCVVSVSRTIKNFENFMLCFIPVFTGTIAMNFKTTTSIGYSSTVFFIAQFISAAISNILLPITGAFLAFSVVGGMCSNLQISAITATVKKITIFALMFMVTIFIGLFSLQTSIAASTDNIGIKAAKFVSSSFIPIIGGALGDALASVVGGLNLIKSAVGGFGILVCLATFVPPIVNIGLFLIMISTIGSIAKSFKINLVDQTCASTKDCLSILLSFLICYGILMISTTSIIINLTSK